MSVSPRHTLLGCVGAAVALLCGASCSDDPRPPAARECQGILRLPRELHVVRYDADGSRHDEGPCPSAQCLEADGALWVRRTDAGLRVRVQTPAGVVERSVPQALTVPTQLRPREAFAGTATGDDAVVLPSADDPALLTVIDAKRGVRAAHRPALAPDEAIAALRRDGHDRIYAVVQVPRLPPSGGAPAPAGRPPRLVLLAGDAADGPLLVAGDVRDLDCVTRGTIRTTPSGIAATLQAPGFPPELFVPKKRADAVGVRLAAGFLAVLDAEAPLLVDGAAHSTTLPAHAEVRLRPDGIWVFDARDGVVTRHTTSGGVELFRARDDAFADGATWVADARRKRITFGMDSGVRRVAAVERVELPSCLLEDRLVAFDSNLKSPQLLARGDVVRIHPQVALGAVWVLEGQPEYSTP